MQADFKRWFRALYEAELLEEFIFVACELTFLIFPGQRSLLIRYLRESPNRQRYSDE